MSYFPVTQICPFSNFIFARESVSLLIFSQCLLTLFRGVSCAWYAINFEGKVPDRVTAFRSACGSLRGTFQISYDVWAFLHELYRSVIFFLIENPKKNLYINERHLLPFRNLLRQLIAIQTLEKRNKVYSQLYWMKTSKVYFKGTVLLTLAKRNFMSSSGNHRTGSGQLDKNGLLSNFRTRSASLSALTLSHRKKPNAK